MAFPHACDEKEKQLIAFKQKGENVSLVNIKDLVDDAPLNLVYSSLKFEGSYLAIKNDGSIQIL